MVAVTSVETEEAIPLAVVAVDAVAEVASVDVVVIRYINYRVVIPILLHYILNNLYIFSNLSIIHSYKINRAFSCLSL